MPSFIYRRKHSFTSFGHRWILFLTVSVWHKTLDATVTLDPERLLSPEETKRIQSAGFYEDLADLYFYLGYDTYWVGPRGHAKFLRYLNGTPDIAQVQKQFDRLDLTPLRRRRIPRISLRRRQSLTQSLIDWGRSQPLETWSPCSLEFRVSSRESAAGFNWRIRKDVWLGPMGSMTNFFAWPPRKFIKRDWRGLEQSGFLRRATAGLKKIGQQGYWRPELFRDPDRLAAEFLKPERGDPIVSWKDFNALLKWRLPGD